MLMACRQRKEMASDKMALWYPEPIATNESDAGDILHAQDARDGAEREAKP